MAAFDAAVVVVMRAIVKPRRWWAAGLEEKVCERKRSWPTTMPSFPTDSEIVACCNAQVLSVAGDTGRERGGRGWRDGDGWVVRSRRPASKLGPQVLCRGERLAVAAGSPNPETRRWRIWTNERL